MTAVRPAGSGPRDRATHPPRHQPTGRRRGDLTLGSRAVEGILRDQLRSHPVRVGAALEPSLLLLQRSAGNRAVGDWLTQAQRPRRALSGTPGAVVVSRQVANSVRLGVEIEGHASPRWKTARNRREARRRNLRLSQRRAQAIKDALTRAIEAEFRDDDVSIAFDVQYKDPHAAADTVTIGSEASGDRQSLELAKGRTDANDEYYRRVDVRIKLLHRKPHDAGRSTTRTVPPVTRNWAVAIENMASGGVAVGVAGVNLWLRNRRTGQVARAHATIYGGTTPELGGGGAAQRGKEVWAYFSTDEPYNWDDFKGTPITVTFRGIGIGWFGTDKTTIGFPALGANRLDVSGWATGGSPPGMAAWIKSGKLKLRKKPPPKIEPVTEPHWTTTDDDASYYVPMHFATGKSDVTAVDRRDLAQLVKEIAADFRARR